MRGVEEKRRGAEMSPRLVLKLSLFGVMLLLAVSVATALIPGVDKWPQAVSYVVLVLAALAAIVYVRKHGEDRQVEPSLASAQVDDSRRWKMGAAVAAMGIFFLLGGLQLPLACLMIASGTALVVQYLWLKRKRARL
jgi:membrane protein implicated in regulation of membrane protease activity